MQRALARNRIYNVPIITVNAGNTCGSSFSGSCVAASYQGPSDWLGQTVTIAFPAPLTHPWIVDGAVMRRTPLLWLGFWLA
jgi:hypothetical protein